jgi:hypothetical protein
VIANILRLREVLCVTTSDKMSTAKHLAVLIGIDFYLEKPLQSCVQDISLIENFLQTANEEGSLELSQIARLTASNPTSPGAAKPPEESSSLPTLQNVTESFRQITEAAVRGDQVYIHYSGHGTVQPGGGFALALLDNHQIGTPCYLGGLTIARILDDMTKKGLRVLLVLDCCFSGGVKRDEDVDNSRYIKYDPACDPDGGQIHIYNPTLDHLLSESNFRDVSTRANWFADPKGYTILTACGPTEQAYELTLDNGKKFGCLSYFLVRTLRKMSELKMSNMAIFQFVCAMFRASSSRQTPQLKGSGDLTFFGHLDGLDDCIFPVIRLPNGELLIQAGEALSVRENEEFALTSLNAVADESCGRAYVTAYARNIGGVESHLELADAEFDPGQIRTGWIARPVRFLTLTNVSDDDAGTQVHDEPSSLDRTQDSGSGDPFVVSPPGTILAMGPFRAIINNQTQFEILDQADKKVNLDALSLLSPRSHNARQQVSHLLSYLARFQEFASSVPKYEDASLREAIDINLCRLSGGSSIEVAREFIEVQDGEILELTVANKSEEMAYVHILCFTAKWELDDLLGNENVPLSADPVRLVMQMTIPETLALQGHKWCEDTIKIFITTRPAAFANMAIRVPSLRTGLRDYWMTRSFRIRTNERRPIRPN